MLKSFFSGLTRLSLRFRWVTIGIVVLFLGAGVYAASRLNQELLPNIEFPQTFIVAVRPGASSEDLRDLITIPLETEALAIKGVIPAGLESTTTSPAAFLIVRNEYGVGQADMQDQLKKAIAKVEADDVPVGLKTTADLTPDIITKVLKRAPSMFKHFEAQHFKAMKPEVLNAALAVNPDFINQIDLQTRDQLAAKDVDAAVTGTISETKPEDLPTAWIVTDKEQPSIFPFDLSSIPVITASIFDNSGKMSADELRKFVDDKIVAGLYQAKIQGLPTDKGVTVSGGQQIPQDVLDAALTAVTKARAQAGTAQTTQPSPQATPDPQTPKQTTTADPAPALPNSWRSPLNIALLRVVLQPIKNFDTADNLLNDGTNPISAASTLNKLAESPSSALLRDLSSDVLTYFHTKEKDFIANLSDKALENLASAPLNSSTWGGLLAQAGFQKSSLGSIMDLAKLKGGSVAGAINNIVASTPKEYSTFAIRLVSSLSPESVTFITRKEPDFISKLDPQVLRYMSSDTLKAIPDSAINALTDDKLKADLKAIIADPTKAAAAALNDTSKIPDDPNAPLLPDSWITGLKNAGLSVHNAGDLLKKPFGFSAGDFVNLIAKQPGGADKLLKDISAEALLYVGQKDATFFNTLAPTTIALFTPETLAKLPPAVQNRASSGPSFTPTSTITRTNSRASLTLSVNKEGGANTVVVADGIDAVFKKIQAENPNIEITTIFEQAGFIRESISGVAREGGLGAIMAVIIILLFLNFSVRSTLVTAVSIPTSIAIALVLMKYVPGTVHTFITSPGMAKVLPDTLRVFLERLFPTSITLNIMTLAGLTVAIGRVVDDSIVVLENIYRQLQKGIDPKQAVVQGTRDVSVAIFAATLTTVVVFLPIGLAGGAVGEFFLPFGLAVTYSLAASFVVAVTIVPLMAFLLIRPENLPKEHVGRMERGYHSLLEWALSHRVIVLGLAFLTLIFGVYLFSKRPTTFLPSLGEVQITVTVSLPTGTPIGQTDVRVRDMEKYLDTLTGTDKPIKKYQTTIGSGGGIAALFGGGRISEESAGITVAINAKSADAQTALTQDIRAQAENIFGQKSVKVSKGSLSDSGFGGFAVVVSGPEDELRAINDKIIATLGTVKGLTNVTSSLNLVGGSSSAYLRIGQKAAVQYSGELETQDTLGLTKTAIAALKALPDVPADLTIGEGFQSQQQTEGFTQTFGSMGIAVVVVYLVMVLTFGSLIHPFTILFSLPLAIVGAALGLTLTNRVLGISALIGLLMLIGIVVTNAIVFLDRVQANRKERNMPTREALVEAGGTRLRPILMTAIATMIALLPLASGASEGAIIASELGTVVIGGLFSSTLLTLLVVPVIYSIFDGLQRSILRRPAVEPKATAGD